MKNATPTTKHNYLPLKTLALLLLASLPAHAADLMLARSFTATPLPLQDPAQYQGQLQPAHQPAQNFPASLAVREWLASRSDTNGLTTPALLSPLTNREYLFRAGREGLEARFEEQQGAASGSRFRGTSGLLRETHPDLHLPPELLRSAKVREADLSCTETHWRESGNCPAMVGLVFSKEGGRIRIRSLWP